MAGNNSCHCNCHKKSNIGVMYCFEIPCRCCSLQEVRYINDDGSIDSDLVANKNIDAWNRYRKVNSIEWFRPNKKSKR